MSNKPFLLLFTLWSGIFCNYASYSIIAPFFPQLARKKGLTAIEYSLVFGSYSLAQIFFSCVVGKCLLTTSPRFAILSGLFLTGGANILFGCMEHSPGGNTFFVLCCCIRFVEGAGFAAYLTSVLATVIKTFPTHPGYYVGLTETVVTIAMISGPPLGSFLYTVGGYSVPFVVMGSVILVTCLVSSIVVKDDRMPSPGRRKPNALTFKEFWLLLRLAGGSSAVACVTCNVTADSFVLISLSDHLRQASFIQRATGNGNATATDAAQKRVAGQFTRVFILNQRQFTFELRPMAVGGVYLCLFLSYGLSSPIAGRLADRMGKEFLLQSCGCLAVALAFALIGPATFISLKPSIGLIVGGLLLKGIGAGPLISCSFSAALRAAKYSGFPDDFRTYSLVSTLVSFSIPLGNLVGGLTTGILCEKLHMSMATTIYVGVFLILAKLCLILHLYEYWPLQCYVRMAKFCKNKRRKPSTRIRTPIERTPLCDNVPNGTAIAMQPLKSSGHQKNKIKSHPILAFLDGQPIEDGLSTYPTYGLNHSDIAAILETRTSPSHLSRQNVWFQSVG